MYELKNIYIFKSSRETAMVLLIVVRRSRYWYSPGFRKRTSLAEVIRRARSSRQSSSSHSSIVDVCGVARSSQEMKAWPNLFGG